MLLIYPGKKEEAFSNLAVHWFFNEFSKYNPDIITFDNSNGIFYNKKISKTPLIFVSLSYGPDLINFASIMKKNGIPLLARNRADGIFPIFICGGIAVLLNPEPLTEIFDAVFLGEGECMANDIRKILTSQTREEVFDFIKTFDYAMTENKLNASAAIAEDGTFFVHSNDKLHLEGNCFNNRKILEMNRGCTSKCKFCAASFAYRKFRQPSCEKILNFINETLKTGESPALMGASLGNVKCFDEILKRCADCFSSISLSSLKIVEINDERVKLLKKCGVKTITVAIESGVPETRKRISKNISDDEIIHALVILKKHNIKAKIYLMAGLPESDVDKEVESISMLLKKLEKINMLGEISLSVAPFVPKPLTPFANESLMTKKEYKKYSKFLLKETSVISKNIKIDFFPYKYSELDYKTGFYKGEEFVKFIIESQRDS